MLGLSNSISIGRGGKAGLWSGWSNLSHYWPLDETSGTRYDVVGTAHLTDVNTVGYAAGMRNNAASFVAANLEKLTIASALTPAAPWSASGWFYIPTGTLSYATLMTGGDGGGDPGKWGLYANSLSITTVTFICRNGVDSLNATVVADAWNFIYVEFAPTPSISTNGGAFVTGTGGLDAGDSEFTIGKAAAGAYLTGNVDEVALFSAVKNAAWCTAMYNSGAGKFYPS